jgi:hypothetical protein
VTGIVPREKGIVAAGGLMRSAKKGRRIPESAGAGTQRLEDPGNKKGGPKSAL